MNTSEFSKRLVKGVDGASYDYVSKNSTKAKLFRNTALWSVLVLLSFCWNVFAQQVPAPLLQPGSADSILTFGVTVTSPAPEATIHYSTTGDDPTLNDPTVASGSTITIGRNLTLKARAFDSEGNASPVTVGNYRITGMLAAGAYHALGLKSNGTLLSWGNQAAGRLGNGTTAAGNISSPVKVRKTGGADFVDAIYAAAGVNHTLALDSAGNPWSFGENASSQLGNNATADSSFAVRVLKSATAGDYLTNMKDLAAGSAFSIAVDNTGKVWTWGATANGRLASAATGKWAAAALTNEAGNPQIGGSTPISKVAAGQLFGLALDQSGRMWSWGDNTSGQLGNGTATNQSRAVRVLLSAGNELTDVTDIAAGFDHTIVLRRNATENGTVWCWGQQSNGRLGNNVGTAADIKYPVQVKTTSGNLENIVQVAGGVRHSLALDSSGRVWAWGYNQDGNLGDGTVTNRSHADLVKLADGTTLDRVVYIAAGGYESTDPTTQVTTVNGYSLALRDDGTLFGWGYNGHGELADATTAGKKFATKGGGSYQFGNQAPAVQITTTGTLIAPANVTLNCAANDPDGVITKVDFYEGDRFLGTSTTAPYSVPWNTVNVGTYSVAAVATDNFGASTEARTNVTINPLTQSADGTRYYRGNGIEPTLHSFVIALDFQKGVRLDPLGDNAAKFSNGQPWFMRTPKQTNRQIGGVTNNVPSYSFRYENPIVAFGREGGGSTLYVNQPYRFGIHAGAIPPYSIAPDSIYATAVWITAYRKSDGQGFQKQIVLPRKDSPADQAKWNSYVNNGYTWPTADFPQDAEFCDLKTTIQFVDAGLSAEPWGVSNSNGYLITHSAKSTDYYYKVEAYGFVLLGSTFYSVSMTDDQANHALTNLYTLDFAQRSPWQSEYVDRPHFNGTPMPSEYVGKSLSELLNAQTAVNIPLTVDPATCLTINHSAELRSHPVLDALVTDLTQGLATDQKAIALANYVLNEVDLTDAVGYNDQGVIGEASINGPGMSRSAFATYLEGQGSPAEQCALLLYMLRKAGVPATYQFPEHNKLLMLDARMSKMLRFQIRGLVDNNGNPEATSNPSQPTLIPVNYPWVAAYINNQWVHIFPWIKDTEIKEGYNLYDLLPEAYNNGHKWLDAYLNGDSAIIPSGVEDDTPSVLFPRFIKQSLQADHPEVSIDDVGVQYINRRHYYSSWKEFPSPFTLTGTPRTVESLKTETKLFDTIVVKVASGERPGTISMQTAEIPVMECFNRRFLVRHNRPTATTTSVSLVLAPFSADLTGTDDFANSFATLGKKQIKTVSLGAADKTIDVTITHKRQRSFFDSYGTTVDEHDRWKAYLGLTSESVVANTLKIGTGDLAAICLNVGRVTRRMLDQHIQEFWRMEQASKSNAAGQDADVYQGGLAYMLGMSYFNKVDEFVDLNKRLHKRHILSNTAHGLSVIKAKRVNGTLPSGAIELVQPYVDMFYKDSGMVGNETLRPDSGNEPVPAKDDFEAINIADGSAQEHQAIDRFFRQTDSISTIKLLRIADQDPVTYAPGIIELNKSNYLNYDSAMTGHDPSLWLQVKNAFTAPGGDYVKAYLTPKPVTGAEGKYTGMGALVIGLNQWSALISKNLNGGYGGGFSFDSAISYNNLNNFSLNLSNDYSLSFSYTAPTYNTQSVFAPQQIASHNITSTLDYAWNNSFTTSFTEQRWVQETNYLLGSGYSDFSSSATFGDTIFNTTNVGNVSSPSFFGEVLKIIGDPVNVVTGSFYVDDVDLSLPGPMPLQIRRNYDSKNLSDSEFGYGWRISCVPYLVLSEDRSVIYAAEMDGSMIAYERQGSTNTWVPTPAKNPHLCNMVGDRAGSYNNIFNAKIEMTAAGTVETYLLTGADGSVRTFKEKSFPIPGDATLTRERPYLEKWQDNRGNYFTFAFGTDNTKPEYGQVTRVTASNGNFIGFVYDTFRHIIEAYAGDGRRIYYSYDQYGDLRRVTLADGTSVDFEYEHEQTTVDGKNEWSSKHLITQELKPEGRILENSYDGDRRVTQQKATAGIDLVPVRNATFEYHSTENGDKTLSGYTLVYDAYNRATRFDFETSQITTVTDPAPLNYQVSRKWYQPSDSTPGAYPRSLKEDRDKRGTLTTYKYDSRGNLTEAKRTGDVTGDGVAETVTTTYAYNGRDLLTEKIVAAEQAGAANRTVYKYDDAAQPWQPTSTETYAGGALVTSSANQYYNVVAGSTASYGLLKQTTTAPGTPDEALVTLTHDSNGWITSETRTTGTADPAVVRSLRYNLRGELVEETDALGRRSVYSYDGRGNKVWTERWDENGILANWQYDYYNHNGELEWTDGPRYYPEDYVLRRYDGAGRIKEELKWRSQAKADGTGMEAVPGSDVYSTTFYKHDLFGNLLEVGDPRHNTVTMQYDEIGRMTNRQFREGDVNGAIKASETFTYEPGGEIFESFDPLNARTAQYYTASGKLRRQENPDGTALEWRYDLLGRPVRETFSNGSYWETVYNDAARTVTRTLHSSTGAVLATESVARDRRGNVVTKTDAEGFTFTTSYDDLNRVKTETGPAASGLSAQQVTTYTYDAGGKVTVAKSSLGESKVTTSDASGRPVRVQIKDVNGTLIRETSFEYSPDHHSVTQSEGVGGSAVQTTTYTDTFGKTALVRHLDGSFSLNAYDALGNREASRDEQGYVTYFINDSQNRLWFEVLPGGTTTEFVYDPAGNLVERRMPNDQVHKTTYDGASRKITEELRNGSAVTRNFGYSYYSSGPAKGRLQKVTDPRGIEATTVYDDFLRPQTVTSTGSQPEHNQTTEFQYDRRNLLLHVKQGYATAAPGPQTDVDRHYDGYGQMIDETVSMAGTPVAQWTQSWNGSGQRSTLNWQLPAQGTGAGQNYAFKHYADGLLGRVEVSGERFDFDYDLNGLLLARENPWRVQEISGRDLRGRPTDARVLIGASQPFAETQNWFGFGKRSSYQTDRVGGGVWKESRSYAYNGRGQLVYESDTPAPDSYGDYLYRFDFESLSAQPTGSGLGVRTAAMRRTGTALNDAQVGSWQVASSDVVHRPKSEGPTTALNNYTLSDVSYDAVGQQTTRTLASGRTQSLTWDAAGRLIKLTERSASNDGFDWSAVYDGLGRRLQTVQQSVNGGVASGAALTLGSIYDPQVEFLELGASLNGQRTWKVYGPDLDGRYGGLQGIGGLEATVDESSGSWTPVVNDAFGNTVGWISGGTMQWNPAQVASYGVLPGSTAQPFDGSHTLAESTLWRSHRIDPTGLYYLGARYYDPSSGRFISADPLGHGSSMSLYDYANGDPANLVDPDGRVAKVVGGGIIAGLGTVALLAPEPTMLSKVFGTAAVLYGADMMVSGVRGFAGGDSRTYTSQGASWTAQQLGASEQTAYWIGEGTDFVVGNVITLGTNAAIKSASSGVNLAANNASRLAPGGGLIAHEAQGGHLLARHLGQTESQLASRLASNPRLSTASTFGTRAEAEAAVSHAFDSNASALSSWLSSGAQGRQVLNAPWNGGTVLQRGASSAVPGTGVRIVLQGNGSGGYYILTGFPTP